MYDFDENSHTKLSMNLELNATNPIQIHTGVVKKLRFEKKVNKMLTSNISEIYGLHFAQRIRLRAIQNLPPQGILKRLTQFYTRNRWMYKTHFFYFSGFTFLLIKKEL